MDDFAFEALGIPSLPDKPRSRGLTSIIDKGLGPAGAADILATMGPWIDVAKLGWGTARLQRREVLAEKIGEYHDHDVEVCTGGTFLEIAYSQGRVVELLDEARRIGIGLVEVSNGVHPMTRDEKSSLIRQVRASGLKAWSEVGRKSAEEDARIGLADRLESIETDLEAGAEKVVLEARESGTIGIYDREGKPASELLHRIVERVGTDCLVFEAPRKSQQVWMIRNFGPEVNLGNVTADEALSVATLRTGLRGDTFADVHLGGVDVHLELGIHGALAAKRRGGIVILIDALRASATIITALAIGMKAVRPVSSPDECVGEITAGERGGRKLPGVDHGNSPTELMRHDYRGKTLVLTTSNATECLLTASGETEILVGSTLNRSAVALAAVRRARETRQPITLLMAGRNNRDTVEDGLAAGEILRSMDGVHFHGETPPSSTALEAAFVAGESGRNLCDLGYEDDVAFCARVDEFDVVPVFRDGLLVSLDR